MWRWCGQGSTLLCCIRYAMSISDLQWRGLDLLRSTDLFLLPLAQQVWVPWQLWASSDRGDWSCLSPLSCSGSSGVFCIYFSYFFSSFLLWGDMCGVEGFINHINCLWPHSDSAAWLCLGSITPLAQPDRSVLAFHPEPCGAKCRPKAEVELVSVGLSSKESLVWLRRGCWHHAWHDPVRSLMGRKDDLFWFSLF